MKVVIYAVISALLLYLYYLKRDLSIFAAFIVVVLEMIRTTNRDGFLNEGLKMGGGGGGGSGNCEKLGFSKPTIAEKTLVADLEKEMKKIKKVADKHWPYDDWKGSSKDESKSEYFKPIMEAIQEVNKDERQDAGDQKKENELTTQMQNMMVMLYDMASSDSKKAKEIKDAIKGELTVKGMKLDRKKTLVKMFNGYTKITDKQVKMFTDASKTDIMKEASKESKKLLDYLICLFTHWNLIFKAMNDIIGKGVKVGDDDDDEEKKDEEEATNDDE
jgi:hypothetical protein